MSTGIIVALIGAVPALVTAIVSVYLNNRVINVKLDMMKEQFDKIEIKVDKHNQVVERVAILERDSKTAFNRIGEIRDKVNEVESAVYQPVK